MPHPAYIQSNLKSQFDKIDSMYLNDDLRVFGILQITLEEKKKILKPGIFLGRDTDRIFKQVDIIRRKQIELATEHIGLDNMEDTSLVYTVYLYGRVPRYCTKINKQKVTYVR